jgi:hypothetical protein
MEAGLRGRISLLARRLTLSYHDAVSTFAVPSKSGSSSAGSARVSQLPTMEGSSWSVTGNLRVVLERHSQLPMMEGFSWMLLQNFQQ